MTRLTRQLLDTDNPEWKRYKKRGFKESGRFYGLLLVFLIVVPLLTVIIMHYFIEASRPQGLPSSYRLVPFQDVYRIVKADALEWDEDATLSHANFEIYPDWGYHREPEAKLFFLSG